MRLLGPLTLRLALALLSIWGALTVVFLVTRLTGDPVRLMSPPGATEVQLRSTKHHLGLDRPITHQYLVFIDDVVHADVGTSYYWNRPALSLALSHLRATLVLAGAAMLYAVALGVPLGLLAAFNHNRLVDRISVAVAGFGQAIPSFWLAPMLILVFAVKLHLMPSTGYGTWKALVLPCVALGSFQLAVLFRMTRAAALEVLTQDYVLLARSKGAGGVRIAMLHVLPNAALPLLTIGGLSVASLIGGSVIVETVFAWPGIGSLMIQAVDENDFPVIQAVALLFSTGYVVINVLVDVSYQMLDPRLRHGVAA